MGKIWALARRLVPWDDKGRKLSPSEKTGRGLFFQALALIRRWGDFEWHPGDDPTSVWERCGFLVSYWDAYMSPEHPHYTILIDLDPGFAKILSMPPPPGHRAARTPGPLEDANVLIAQWIEFGQPIELSVRPGNWAIWFSLIDPVINRLKQDVKTRGKRDRRIWKSTHLETQSATDCRGSHLVLDGADCVVLSDNPTIRYRRDLRHLADSARAALFELYRRLEPAAAKANLPRGNPCHSRSESPPRTQKRQSEKTGKK